MSDKDPKKLDDDKKVVEQENSSIEFLFSFEIYSPKVQPIWNNEPVKPLKSIEFTLNPFPKNTTSKEKRQVKSTKQQDDMLPLEKVTEDDDEKQDEKGQDIVKYEIGQSQQQQQTETEKQVTAPIETSLFSQTNTSNVTISDIKACFKC